MVKLEGCPPKKRALFGIFCDGILVSRNEAVKVSQISFSVVSKFDFRKIFFLLDMFFCVCYLGVSPYEKDCYLGVSRFKSQTTQQFTMS